MRTRLPMSVALVQSDAVAVATVARCTETGPYAMEIGLDVERVLVGAIAGSVVVQGRHAFDPGTRLLAHLARVGERWRLLGRATVAHRPEVEDRRWLEIAHTPRWPAAVQGWSAVMVLSRSVIVLGDDVDAWIVYRNFAATPQVLSYQEWPPVAHTWWELDVRCGEEVVAPVRNPNVTDQDIDSFFSSHGHNFESVLGPGECFTLPLTRVNSAKAGHGYKQRLGFCFWPLERPDHYTFRGVERGLLGREPLHTPAVGLQVVSGT